MDESIGERIRTVRKSKNLTQKVFAERLGISQTHISKIEKGIENPSDTLVILISHLFFSNLEWLKTGIPYALDYDNSNPAPMLERYTRAKYVFEQAIPQLDTDSLWNAADTMFICAKLITNSVYINDPEMMSVYTSRVKKIIDLLFISIWSIKEYGDSKNSKNNYEEMIDVITKVSKLRTSINNEMILLLNELFAHFQCSAEIG